MNRQHRASSFLFALAGLGTLAVGIANAQLTPLGPEVRVDTLAGDQFPNDPRIGVQPDGRFVVGWDGGGSGPPQIFARHFTASGVPTGPTQLTVGNPGYYPLIDAVEPAAGGFDVLFSKINDLRPERPIFYRQHLNLRGKPDGGPAVRVGVAGTRWIWKAGSAGFLAGRIGANGHGLAVQRIAADGRLTGPEIRLNSRAVDVTGAFVFGVAEGGFVAVWSGRAADLPVLRARRFSAAGVPLGRDFDVATDLSIGAAGSQLRSFVAMAAPSGGFAVVWDTQAPAQNIGLYQRIFEASGQTPGPETGGPTPDDSLGLYDADVDPAGNVLVLTLRLREDPFRRDLQIQLFDRAGAAVGPSQGINTGASGRYQEPFIGRVAWAGSSWLVAWAGEVADLNPSAIFVRRFVQPE